MYAHRVSASLWTISANPHEQSVAVRPCIRRVRSTGASSPNGPAPFFELLQAFLNFQQRLLLANDLENHAVDTED